MADGMFLDGEVRYPEGLPCPHADTDLTPRERRYISDIGEVKKLRRFQSTFQATRQNISFVFTPEQARIFREWYKHDIVEGGAWFYADWAILHKEKDIAYRFVTRPVWEFLARGNYHVSATVELYGGRKVFNTANVFTRNVFTSKLYPLYLSDDICVTRTDVVSGRLQPMASIRDDVRVSPHTIRFAQIVRYVYRDYIVTDDVTVSHVSVTNGDIIKYVYRKQEYSDSVSVSSAIVISGSVQYKGKVPYTYYTDEISTTHATVIAGEME